MRVGSLCTGYGGLDLAIGGDLAFVSEIDGHANTVIEQKFPGVPNLGDFTDCDIPRTGQLKILGNGVVPQQAQVAWEMLR